MVETVRRAAIAALCAVALAACAPAPPAVVPGAARQVPMGSATESGRTLVLVLRAEPVSLAGTQLRRLGITTGTQRRIFNAGLMLMDGEGTPHPYLAEAFPRLHSGSWLVFPDGRMETTYRLKPHLSWHDGAPLTTEDFVFAWRVYTTPELGISGSAPQSYMEEVSAPDPRTLIIRWARPFPEADLLEGFGKGSADNRLFTPLPRHLLERTFDEQREGFLSDPFWTTGYVGLGPYRLERWEPGAFIETAAFEGHALGRPKIGRLKLIFNSDANSTLATLLAGGAHMPADDPIRLQQASILKQEWAARGQGTVEYLPSLWRSIHVQHRSEYANPKAILDVRVRRALAHAIDKRAINDALFEGEAILADTPIPPTEATFQQIDRAIAKYPYDLRRTEALMAEAGFVKRADGFYAGAGGSRLNFELQVIASAQNEAERAIIADGWHRVGFEIDEATITAAQTQDRQVFVVFRSLSTTSGAQGPNALHYFTTASIARPETRWIGQNRGGWSQPEYDRLFDAYQTTLDRAERIQHLVEATKILTQHLGVLPLYFNPGVVAYSANLSGVRVRAAEAEVSWNIHMWELS